MSLQTVSISTFYTELDAALTTVASPYVAGSGTLVVRSGSLFGSPSPSSPVRLTAQSGSSGNRVHYALTAVSGNTLTVAPIDGYSDINLAVGDQVGVTDSAEAIQDLQVPILALEAALNSHAITAAPLASPSLSGVPTAPTAAPGTNDDQIATTSFVSAAASSGSGSVTSVGLTVPSGFSISGSPITTSGTLAISTSLIGIVKGNGTGLVAATAGTDYVVPSGNIATSTTAGTVSGIVAIANGGTGQTTATNALDALVPSQSGNS